jgi:hypothetical protein
MVITMRTRMLLIISLAVLFSFILAAATTNYYAIADEDEREGRWENLYEWGNSYEHLYEYDREDSFLFSGIGAFGGFGFGGIPYGNVYSSNYGVGSFPFGSVYDSDFDDFNVIPYGNIYGSSLGIGSSYLGGFYGSIPSFGGYSPYGFGGNAYSLGGGLFGTYSGYGPGFGLGAYPTSIWEL